jgi:Holliday junction resolvasome RuvABC endonuclease subunit
MNWTEKRKGASRGSRLLRYWRWLHMVNAAEPLSLVVWEDAAWIPTAANANTAAAYAQFEGIALMFAARHDIPTDSVHNSTLKKAITGSGKHPKGTSKAKIAESVRALGYVFETQDECDAIAVLHWATARHRVARRILG